MIKRAIPLFLSFALCIAAVPFVTANAAASRNHITDRDAVDGSHYTASPALAEELNSIFDGNASIYSDKSCTNPVETELGSNSVRNNGIRKYVVADDGTVMEMGTSCFIYANGVYYTLFGETAGEGEPGENSEMLDISKTASRRASYENFKIWGVRQGVGALIRASGHSLILLDYDEHSISYLDGNGDGHGLVSVNHETWDEFFYSHISYIIQPMDHHYDALYAAGMCGEDATWAVDNTGTLILSGTGNIQYAGWRNYHDKIQKIIVEDGIAGIGNGLFHDCRNLTEISFLGAAPKLEDHAFLGVNATIYYPATGRGWGALPLQNYAGTLIWVPYGMTELRITSQPEAVYSARNGTVTVSIGVEGDGLIYTWYVKHADADLYVKSSFSGPVYSAPMSGNANDLFVLCVVNDQYNNIIISESTLLRTGNPVPSGN